MIRLDHSVPLESSTDSLSFAQQAEQALRVSLPSATQRRVLWTLFQRPWAWQHLSGVARVAGLPGSSTTKALHELVEKGLVQEDHLANLRIFQPRMDYARCEKLRRQFVQAFGAPSYLLPSLSTHPDVVAALVFGSVAKGADNAHSDVDLMVITARPGVMVHHDTGMAHREHAGVPLEEPGTQREVRMVQACLEDLDRRIQSDPSCFWAAVLAGTVLPVYGDVEALVHRYFPQREDITALPAAEASWSAGNDTRHRLRESAFA